MKRLILLTTLSLIAAVAGTSTSASAAPFGHSNGFTTYSGRLHSHRHAPSVTRYHGHSYATYGGHSPGYDVGRVRSGHYYSSPYRYYVSPRYYSTPTYRSHSYYRYPSVYGGSYYSAPYYGSSYYGSPYYGSSYYGSHYRAPIRGSIQLNGRRFSIGFGF